MILRRIFWIAFSAVSMQFAAFISSISAQNFPESQWTGTWATPPVQVDSHRSFNRQTLRQIVYTSIGGTSARICISNLFGKQPLRIEDVHLARRGNGSSILTCTDRRLLFRGSPSVTIPAGATAVSDPVSLAVPPLADLAISMYLAEATRSPTFNPAAPYRKERVARTAVWLTDVSTVMSMLAYRNLFVSVRCRAVRTPA